jgi:hypothetical protein
MKLVGELDAGTSSFDERDGKRSVCHRPQATAPPSSTIASFCGGASFGSLPGKTDIDGRVAMTQDDTNDPHIGHSVAVPSTNKSVVRNGGNRLTLPQ